MKNVHLLTAIGWAVALAAIVVLGDRRRLADDWREIEAIDRDDRRWLCKRDVPQGRFNAGQKINALLSVAFAILFVVTGVLLWLGQRDHTFFLEGNGTVHVGLTFASVILLLGHLYLAVVHPRTRHALRGITRGDVDRDWAVDHHAEVGRRRGAPPRPARRRLTRRSRLRWARGHVPLRRRRRLHRHAADREPAGGVHRRARPRRRPHAGARPRDQPLRDRVRPAARGRRPRADAHLHDRRRAAVRGAPGAGHRLRPRRTVAARRHQPRDRPRHHPGRARVATTRAASCSAG